MSEHDFEGRLQFQRDKQIMEVDFSNMVFDRSRIVNRVYDHIDRKLAETGQKWFFLVNYLETKIMAEAWIAFAHRGKLVNIAHSLGSARFATSSETSETILEKSQKEKFDPNLFDSRQAAIDHLMSLKEKFTEEAWQQAIIKQPDEPGKTLDERIVLHHALNILEVDFSHYTFASSDDVRAFYWAIGERLEATGKQWYFMVNYEGTEILPDAWFQWRMSSKSLNAAYSLGTVRFNPSDTTAQSIRKRADSEQTSSNLVATRQDALARIEDMKNT